MENNGVPVVPSIETAPSAESRLTRRKRLNWSWLIVPLALLGGMVIGYLGRPLLMPTRSSASGEDAPILQLLISKTRHWQGSANAPVTMLEFSDFQ